MYEQHRKILAGCGLIMLLGFAGLYYFATTHVPSEQSGFPGEEEASLIAESKALQVSVKPPSPGEQIDALARNPSAEDALERCRSFLQKGPAEARDAALERMPRLLENRFHALLQAKAHGQAHTLLEEMDALELQLEEGDKKKERWKSGRENMHRQWRDTQQQRMRDALQAADPAVVDALTDEAWADSTSRLPGREFLTYTMKRWKDARTAGKAEEAERLLRRSAEVAAGERTVAESWGFERTAVEETLRGTLTREQLLSEGQRLLAAKDFVLAACYLTAHREPQNDSVPKKKEELHAWWLARLQRRLLGYEALLGLAREGMAGRVRWLPPDFVENRIEILLSIVTHSAQEIETFDQRTLDPKEKYRLPAEAWKTNFELLQDLLARFTKAQDFSRAESLAQRTLQFGSQEYRLQFGYRYLKEDPWVGVPASLRAAIEKKTRDPGQQVGELMMAVNTGEYIPEIPGKSLFIEGRANAQMRQGIALLERSPGQAYWFFRQVLRLAPKGAAAQEVRDALFKAIRTARDTKNFGALYSHAGCFIGELGAGGAAPEIREELADCLRTAADFFKQSRPIARVFMLSLLADVLPGDPRGRAAEQEASALGFEAVANLKLNKPNKPDLLLPSLLKGLSIVGADNATDYHLLAFFEGPEKFFVRSNPHRRNCVVLKDGTYISAVFITDESVTPYKAETTYQSQYWQTKYVIVTHGPEGDKRKDPLLEAYGDYTLLRSPPDAGELIIEPKSGLVLKRGTALREDGL